MSFDCGKDFTTVAFPISFNFAFFVGLYPLIGWKIQDELVYLAEGVASDTGIAMEWAKSIGKLL